MPKTQKVTFSVTIEVDVEGWDMAYATGTSAKEIRDDVRAYFVNTLQAGDAGDGSIKSVTPRWSK